MQIKGFSAARGLDAHLHAGECAMSYATLMVYVNVDHASKALVSVAADLASKFSAKLIGLSALAIVPPVVAEGVVIVDHASELEIAQMRKSLAEAGDKFRAAAGAIGEMEWRSALEIPPETLIREARYADLIIIEKSGRSIDFHRAIDPGTAIMGAGRPFMVVPSGIKTLAAEHVLDHRFQEGCHLVGFICRFELLYSGGGALRRRIWRYGGVAAGD
jgi:nucleotide-binding universal stress UspA family protein